MEYRMTTSIRLLVHAALLAAALVPAASHALYKVVGPDGKVTYTDRPPATAGGEKITSLSGSGSSVVDTQLPLELRQAAARYPVTLYTTADCAPCETARRILRQRGIPYAEKLLLNNDDGEALLRLSAGREVPTLTIGVQALRGLSSDVWNSYLDLAGYPRESRLPASYQYPAATPLTERREVSEAAPRKPAPPPVTVSPAPANASASGIKF